MYSWNRKKFRLYENRSKYNLYSDIEIELIEETWIHLSIKISEINKKMQYHWYTETRFFGFIDSGSTLENQVILTTAVKPYVD